MFTKISIVLCLLLVLIVESEADCICEHRIAGTICGQYQQMKDCLKDHIYQCNGEYGSKAHHYGPCTYGCAIEENGKDYCRKEPGDCICLNTCGGTHCGQSILLGNTCLKDHIYQCNGQYGSTAHHYGPCKLGCQLGGCSLDHCKV